ncbi:MAG: hypothetical protein LBJ74_04390, partial [Heliobacteriaceae bacterium]|nr:hypothetical protein [Heliobacteriaceae bacterium]
MMINPLLFPTQNYYKQPVTFAGSKPKVSFSVLTKLEDINKEIEDTEIGTYYSEEAKAQVTRSDDKYEHNVLTKEFEDGDVISVTKLCSGYSCKIDVDSSRGKTMAEIYYKDVKNGFNPYKMGCVEVYFKAEEVNDAFFMRAFNKFLGNGKARKPFSYINPEYEKAVLEAVKKNPYLGRYQLAGDLQEQGIEISAKGVLGVLKRNNLETEERRVNYLEYNGVMLKNAQKLELETKKAHNRRSEEDENLIIDFSLRNPLLGREAVAKELQEQGHKVYTKTVFNVWGRNDLESPQKR